MRKRRDGGKSERRGRGARRVEIENYPSSSSVTSTGTSFRSYSSAEVIGGNSPTCRMCFFSDPSSFVPTAGIQVSDIGILNRFGSVRSMLLSSRLVSSCQSDGTKNGSRSARTEYYTIVL
jgi:hypothetical protein